MPNYTGTLSDFGLDPQPGLHPILRFVPSGGAVDGGRVLFAREMPIVPDAAGAFSVFLHDLSSVRPACWYTAHVVWLNGEDIPVGRTDIPGQIFTTSTGGPIGDWIVTDGSSAGLIWYGLAPPTVRGRYVFWNKVDASNLDGNYDLTVGDIYEWRP